MTTGSRVCFPSSDHRFPYNINELHTRKCRFGRSAVSSWAAEMALRTYLCRLGAFFGPREEPPRPPFVPLLRHKSLMLLERL